MAFVANKWKPIELEGNLFNSALSEGLIGIEECTEYDDGIVITNKKKRTKSSTHKDNKKPKNSHEPTSEPPLQASLSGSTANTSIIDSAQVESRNMQAWEQYNLPESILRALEEQGFYQPTAIQAYTLPPAILGKRDILGAAETGSGKTLAFGLPILSGIMWLKQNSDKEPVNPGSDSEDEEDFSLNDDGTGCVTAYKVNDSEVRKPLYALVLTPTRELAIQVKNHLTNVAKYTGINVAVVVGGMAAVKQERLLSKGPEIVVGTPGRLWELVQQGNQHLSQIDNIKFLAIDETDRMLEKGHFQELHDLLERINLDENNKKQRQNFVFSATLTLIHDIPRHLLNKSKIKGRKLKSMSPEQKLEKIVETLGVTNPKVVDLSEGKGTSGTLTESRITCAIEEKDYYIYYFLSKHPGRTLVFCNSIGCVKRLTNLLGLLDCNPLPLHASMQQRQRLKNLERFRDDENGVLIATDVAARGLDIPKIDHVIHYQTPRTSEGYVHRSGRTARASTLGLTVLIMEPNEFNNYIKVCKTLGKEEDLPLFPVQDKYLNAVKERVNLARELDKLELQVRKATSEEGWLQKAAKEMDIIVDGISKKYDNEETGGRKKVADLKRKQLTTMLATPVFPKGFSGRFPLLQNTTPDDDTAIDVMKSAIEANSKQKKKNIPLFKPKPAKNGEQKSRNVFIKLSKDSKRKNGNRDTRKPKRKGRK